MCSHLALLEAFLQHSDDCYWVWVMDDTLFRLIRGDEAISLLEQYLLCYFVCGIGLLK